MYSNYLRVIPRDLFNESKLLKCIGRLVLLLHDDFRVCDMQFKHDGEPFEIFQQDDDGALFVGNIHFTIGDQQLFFKSKYNSKSNYTLYLENDYCDYLVFDESGNYTEEFKTACEEIALISHQ